MVDATFRTQLPGWHARIEGERAAELVHPGGGLRDGTEYTVGLLHDGSQYVIQVAAFLADDVSAAARADRLYQRQAVLRQVFGRLEAGWTPADGVLPAVIIANPAPGFRHPQGPRRPFLDRLMRG